MYKFLQFEVEHITYKLNYDINKDTDKDTNKEIEKYNEEFDEIRKQLSSTKNVIDTISEQDYSYLSQNLDVYKTMKQILYRKYNMQVVTNATIKIYEIITQMDIIKNNKLNAFFNAELPGGFIVGVNHYMKTMFDNSSFNWVASSYISKKGTLGDKFGIYEFNKNNWLMDSDMNGNLMDKNNITIITKKVLKRFPKGVDLYTSDAGFDVSSDYNTQEEQTLLLNYGQIITGLFTLAIDGSMITKQFTFFTPFSRSMIILLSSLFEKIFITKPATSRPLNSEIYVVCIKFKGISDNLKDFLLDRMDNIDPNIPIILYKPTETLLNIAKYIYIDNQVKYINYAFDVYATNKYINKSNYRHIHDDWLKYNPMKPIKKEDFLLYNNY